MVQQAYATNLPFTPGGNPLLGAMTGVGGLAGQYALDYSSALNANKTNYENIVGNYQKLMSNLDEMMGPESLQADFALLDRDYAQRAGSEMVRSIDLGKGQTTAATAAQRGASFDAGLTKAKMLGDLRKNRIGLQASLGQGLFGFQERVSSPYPDAGAYNQLFGNLMGFQQAQQARQDQMAAAAIGRVSASGGGGVNVIGAGGRGVPAVNTGGGQRGYVDPVRSSGGTVGMGGTFSPAFNGQRSVGANPGGYGAGAYIPSPYAGGVDAFAGGVASSAGNFLGGIGSGLSAIGSSLFGGYGGGGGGVSSEPDEWGYYQ